MNKTIIFSQISLNINENSKNIQTKNNLIKIIYV
jgi:hypothetical protein